MSALRSLLRVTFAALVCLIATVPMASAAPTSAAQERDVLQLVNQARAGSGLPPLAVRAPLTKAARAHSRDMVARGYFAHDTLGGPAFGDRILGYYKPRSAIGETIGWGAGATGTPAQIVAGWMRSPPHRATLLDRRYTQVGIGIAAGTFAGAKGARVYTADFGG